MRTDQTPTLESVTADRDKYKSSAEASGRALTAVRQALGIDKTADLGEAIAGLIAERDAYAEKDTTLPPLDRPEAEGTRSFGRDSSPERFVHVERIDFAQDLGYNASAIHRRAAAAVKRALGGDEEVLPGLPAFRPERALTVTVEIS